MLFVKNVFGRGLLIIALAVFCTGQNQGVEASSDFDVSEVASSAVEKIQWHGSYEFEYWDADKTGVGGNSTFDAHKIVVWMGVPINDKVFLSSEVEYEHFPRLSDAGAQRNGGSGELKLDSAQLRITPIENSTIYMGVFYVPFGIEYLSYPGQKNKLITRPKLMKGGGIIPGTWSDVGVGFNQVFSRLGQADLFYVNGDANNGGISMDSKTGGNENKSVGVRFMLDGIHSGLNIGASFVFGRYDAASAKDSQRLGGHLRVDTDKITGISMAPVLLAEYVTGSDEEDSSRAKGATFEDRKVSGFYAQLSSRLFSLLEITARYGQHNNDKEKASNLETEVSGGLTLHLMKNFLVKGEYKWDKSGTEVENSTVAFQAVAHW